MDIISEAENPSHIDDEELARPDIPSTREVEDINVAVCVVPGDYFYSVWSHPNKRPELANPKKPETPRGYSGIGNKSFTGVVWTCDSTEVTGDVIPLFIAQAAVIVLPPVWSPAVPIVHLRDLSHNKIG